MSGQLAERDLDIALADVRDHFLDGQRRRRREQGGFDRARELVHHAALSLIGPNRSSWANSSRPRRASSSIAEEARGQRRAPELRVLGRRQKCLEEGPVERRPDHPRDPLDRLVERHHRTRMDDVHRRLGARAHGAIGREQVEIAHQPGRLAHQPQAFRSAAHEHVAADAVAAEQPGSGLAHRVQLLEPHLEPERDLLGTWVGLGVLGQQQARLEVGEPRRHHEVIGGDLELQRPRLRQISRDIARPDRGSRSGPGRPSARGRG